ncbi:allophanate hydrolase [Mitsuokella sp. AF33-22]|uniref:allophanate hydrolase n=1 Tax=Mitsuokella sp. AF33-22 TaxID=2292047 RepID=UPI000E4E88E1|nr:allophanate hydrolase [Mitsuokella sp. AF33-22]RHM53030.1 allophanate hydrolase [Mitsuokella sp. AF33-22]
MKNNVPEILTIPALKAGYEHKAFTPEDVLSAILSRVEAHKDNPIWITPPEEKWITIYLRRLPPMDFSKYPLWGIPFAIKDNIDLEGIPTTAACPSYSYTPGKSAFVIDRLIKAGAIPLGKTNLDQFATGLVGTRSPYGEVQNAWQPECISGGSSSGSAVSVALGQAAFSLGTDTAGSGRVPAMLNTLIGYKPPIGAWSSAGVVPACQSLDCVTVFAHSLEEVEIVDQVARALDPVCVWSRDLPLKVKRLPAKILLPKDMPTFYGPWAENYQIKWMHALRLLEQSGSKIECIDTSFFSKAASLLYDGAYVAERWADLGEFVTAHEEDIFPVTKNILKSGGREALSAARLFKDFHQLSIYRKQANQLLENAVLVLPTAGGSFTRDEVRENPVETNSQMGLYTNHCNLLDLAAIAIPENSEDHDHPFGITCFSLHDQEQFIRALAGEFLKANGAEKGE